MFAQPSRANLSRPMSVPPGSPRQTAGGGFGGKGGGGSSQVSGSPGKGGGGRPMQAFGNINKMNTDIGSSGQGQYQRPMADMFSGGSSMVDKLKATHNASAASGMPNSGSIDRTGTLTSLPYMGSPNAGQAAIQNAVGPTGGIASQLYAPNLTVADVQRAQPMGQMLPPSQPSPQTLTPLPGFQPQQAMPSPQTLTPMPGFQPQQAMPSPQIPQLPAGLMQRLQSFGGF